MGNSSAFGSVARKAIAWLIVAVRRDPAVQVRGRRPSPAFCQMVFGLALLALVALRSDLGRPQAVIYLALAVWFGVATGIVGRIAGSSFFIWS